MNRRDSWAGSAWLSELSDPRPRGWSGTSPGSWSVSGAVQARAIEGANDLERAREALGPALEACGVSLREVADVEAP